MYNALDGRCYGMAYRLEQGVTVLQVPFFDTDSLLLLLQPVSLTLLATATIALASCT